MLSVVMLSVVMLSSVMLSVVAPFKCSMNEGQTIQLNSAQDD